ncbi:MAG: hypothetical protein VX640_06625 [Pseudomonadota bacterium]|nr:hypothetical protein [Pseudomonadota bacterium]
MRRPTGFAAASSVMLLAGCQSVPEADAPAAAVAPVTDGSARCELCGAGPVASPEILAFAAETETPLKNARYMEKSCGPGSFAGWEGFPLIQCAYAATNSDGEKRAAKVVMLNPSAEQLARWIFASCRAVGKDNDQCRKRLFRQTLAASGGQFPVAGVVLEDILPHDGFFESYTFRNGVTVRLEGAPNGTTRQLSETEIETALSASAAVASSRRYARIVSTSPDDYRANGGTAAVGSTAAPALEWPETVGALYRAAWGADENELMTAWARAHADAL